MKFKKSSFIIFLFFLNVAVPKKEKVEVGFSPGRSAIQIILNSIKNAKNKIDIAAYSFTNKLIAIELLNARDRGVNVRVLADKRSNKNRYTALTFLVHNNISVRLNSRYSIMHNKFMVIDSFSVETGSFNYTKNAVKRNAENVILIHGNLDVVRMYSQEFNRLWEESEILLRNY